jgi:tagatose 1,6-diphosphate aldolase
MTTAITNEKKRGLEAVADSQGVIAALAIDQRGALRSLFAKAMRAEPASLPAELLVTSKEAASRILTPHASAILLDPEYGLPAAKQRAKSAGLLLAYEQTGYDKQVRGRMPRLLQGWTVERLVEAGADSEATAVLLDAELCGDQLYETCIRETGGSGMRGSRRAFLSGAGELRRRP